MMEGDLERNVEETEATTSSRCNNSSGSHGARQMAVNFMPSRQLPYNTLRRRRNNSEQNNLLDETDNPDSPETEEEHDPVNKQASIICKELEQQQQLMDDNPVSEELRSAQIFIPSRQMEGQFGSAVGSYFRMVRRLFLIDLSLSLLLIAFVVMPQGLHDGVARNETSEVDLTWGVGTWLTGQGRMQETLMYYGHYHDGPFITAIPYSMPFAYFFTMLTLYLVFFVVLCYRTAYSYRRHFIETAGGVSHVFANKVFCGWDFGIVSDTAARLNATSIYHELQELLSEHNKKKSSLKFWPKFLQRSTNIIISLLVFTTIGGLLYGLWKLLEAFGHWEVSISMLIILVVTVCPALFHLVGRLEYYSHRTSLYVTLCRTWLLDVSIILLLFVFWSKSDTTCWETRFGQQAYRLVLLDTIISLFVLPLVEIIRACMYKRNPKGSPPEFNIAYNSLTLIYNQSVLWFGMLFSPMLSLAITLKFLFLFYVKRECAIRACQPARKVWRAAQTQTVLYMLVTLSLFTTLFGIGSLFLSMPSQECGPFRAYSSVISVLTEGVLQLESRPRVRLVLASVTRPGVLACVVLATCVSVYWWRGKARAQQNMVHLLRHMLVLQARDKDFLLTAIDKVANGEWLYSPKPASTSDSHTYRYMRQVRQPNNSSYRLSRHNATDCDGDSDTSFTYRHDGSV